MTGGDVGGRSTTPKMESNSLFYLGPQDHPRGYITPTRLHGDNYDDWASDIRMALESHIKFGYLNGMITKRVPPTTATEYSQCYVSIMDHKHN